MEGGGAFHSLILQELCLGLQVRSPCPALPSSSSVCCATLTNRTAHAVADPCRQDPASKPIAAEDLRRYAPIYANDMLRDTKVLQLLGGLIREAPDSPAACSAMLALSTLTMPPAGRARVCGVSGVIGPLIRCAAKGSVFTAFLERASHAAGDSAGGGGGAKGHASSCCDGRWRAGADSRPAQASALCQHVHSMDPPVQPQTACAGFWRAHA